MDTLRGAGLELSGITWAVAVLSAGAGAAATLILGLVTQRNKDRQSLTMDQNEMIRTLWEQTQTQSALIQQLEHTHTDILRDRSETYRKDMAAVKELYEQRIKELEQRLKKYEDL